MPKSGNLGSFFGKQPQCYDYEIVSHGKNLPFVLCSRIDWSSILLQAAFGQIDLSHLNQRDDLKTYLQNFASICGHVGS